MLYTCKPSTVLICGPGHASGCPVDGASQPEWMMFIIRELDGLPCSCSRAAQECQDRHTQQTRHIPSQPRSHTIPRTRAQVRDPGRRPPRHGHRSGTARRKPARRTTQGIGSSAPAIGTATRDGTHGPLSPPPLYRHPKANEHPNNRTSAASRMQVSRCSPPRLNTCPRRRPRRRQASDAPRRPRLRSACYHPPRAPQTGRAPARRRRPPSLSHSRASPAPRAS